MRSALQIRNELLRIRDRNRLPYVELSRRSRCSRKEIWDAILLRATQETLIRLDAFLDAPKLHHKKSETELLWRIEELDREIYREYGEKSMHPWRVQLLSEDRQRRLYLQLDFKAKALLVKKIYAEHKVVFKIPDGQSYWHFKVKCLRRTQALRSFDRDNARLSGPRAVV